MRKKKKEPRPSLILGILLWRGFPYRSQARRSGNRRAFASVKGVTVHAYAQIWTPPPDSSAIQGLRLRGLAPHRRFILQFLQQPVLGRSPNSRCLHGEARRTPLTETAERSVSTLLWTTTDQSFGEAVPVSAEVASRISGSVIRFFHCGWGYNRVTSSSAQWERGGGVWE